MVSIPQYVITAFAVNIGKPFRTPAHENRWFLFSIITFSFANLGIQITTNETLLDFMAMKLMPDPFMRFVVIISIINAIASLAWEWGAVPLIARFSRQHSGLTLS